MFVHSKSVTQWLKQEEQRFVDRETNRIAMMSTKKMWSVIVASPDQERAGYCDNENNSFTLTSCSRDDHPPPVDSEHIVSFIDVQRKDKTSRFATFVATTSKSTDQTSPLSEEEEHHDASIISNVLGIIHCQIWKGPVPLVVKEEVFKLGSIWGLNAVSKDVAKSLIEEAVQHLKSIGCKSALTMAASPSIHDWFCSVRTANFEPGNLLTLDMDDDDGGDSSAMDAVEGITIEVVYDSKDIVEQNDEDGQVQLTTDALVARHWERMWTECGVPKEMIEDDLECRTLDFVQNARSNGLGYATVIARLVAEGGSDEIIGSASCQIWHGVAPIDDQDNKFGTVWAVYVRPEYRKRGIARALMQRVIAHWKQLGCKRGILVHASEEGRRVYSRLGFRPNNCLVASLVDDDDAVEVSMTEEEEKKEEEETISLHVAAIDKPTLDMVSELRQYDMNLVSEYSNSELTMLLQALPTQLQAVFGHHDTESDEAKRMALISAVQSIQKRYGVIDMATNEGNWFVKNSGRIGRGFDMKKLAADPTKLAAKFDRLAPRYDHWHVGNQSQVENWVAKRTRLELTSSRSGILSKADTVVLDAACGIGLQAGVLRLAGYKGHMIGIDISPGMITRANDRGTYDEAYAVNVHDGLKELIGDASVDLVICTGAMELLDHSMVLSEFARVLKSGGQLWTSMQWEGAVDEEGDPLPNPTAHQNVCGITCQDALSELDAAGFSVNGAHDDSITECKCAFRTPSPLGDGTFLPVPYLFIAATRN